MRALTTRLPDDQYERLRALVILPGSEDAAATITRSHRTDCGGMSQRAEPTKSGSPT